MPIGIAMIAITSVNALRRTGAFVDALPLRWRLLLLIVRASPLINLVLDPIASDVSSDLSAWDLGSMIPGHWTPYRPRRGMALASGLL